MKITNLVTLRAAVRWGRHAIEDVGLALWRMFRRPAPGEFQPYPYTHPDRYPWLFEFAVSRIGWRPSPRILSFGCSRGDEVFSLRSYFPSALLKGIDISPRNIGRCRARARAMDAAKMSFETAPTTAGESTGSYDAIFCLAVLVNGDLTLSKAQRSDPLLLFENFDRMIGDFARCLKPGGLLVLHTTSFRFCDTAVAPDFDAIYEADPKYLALDVIFDRHNRLMRGERERYRAVVFEKH